MKEVSEVPARKTAAKKVASKAPAKKTVAKKTTPAKTKPAALKGKSASAAQPSNVEELAARVCTAIRNGDFDGSIADIDNAVNARISAQASERAAAKKTAAPAPKKVSAAPKRNAKVVEAVVPEDGKTYKINSKIKKLEGAKVKFIRFKAEDDSKGVVELMVDKPGYPKGKRSIVPVSALSK